ncbi:hypothetical protein B0H15DRAFT_956247 [Mycena belliarum]|uniref:Uncharacterized protein n=1 Tax=Mycena belliarum TaxID=1033014 RepID=A0AAD6XFG9_9AGAR|nr:hypothetical protein B0H15DRAFT_956245 [Mycena belliae]KAJ7075752.1 hypothetical protein B0H15DRAFT_956247 [Mycena belliae]
MSSTKPKVAVVESHSNKLPTLHEGEISPLAANDFEISCLNYFAAKDIAAERQVAVILGCFRSQAVNNWSRPAVSRTRLMALTFAEFMAEFRTKFLRPHWEKTTRAQVLGSRMLDTETFSDWATNVEALHSLLIGTTAELDTNQLRYTLEAGMLPTLATLYGADDTAPGIEKDKFDEWRSAVILIDERRAFTLEENRKAIERELSLQKRKAPETTDERPYKEKKFGEGRKGASKPVSTASTSSSTSGRRCPVLTADERKWLDKYEGCNKCRTFFAGHKHADCPNDFPAAEGYKPRTEADAKAAAKGKSKPIAVIMPPAEDIEDSDDSEEDLDRSVSTRPHHVSHAVHLFWECLAEGPMTNLPLLVRALIDNGAHLALINADLADKMGLRRRRLHRPEPISLAMSSEPLPATHLTEYVKLPLHTVDQAWSSSSVRFLVAPNLCADFILGLPWLIENHIVIDHRERTAIDKRVGFDILHPPAPSPHVERKPRLRERLRQTDRDQKTMQRELLAVCEKRRIEMERLNVFEDVNL